MDSKKLFVDVLNEEKTLGMVINQKLFQYNLYKLDRLNKPSYAYSAGRFIIIHLIADDNTPTMNFLDVRKDPGLVKIILGSKDLTNDEKLKFTALIEAYNSTYEATKYDIELVAGWPPGLIR